MDSSIFSKSKIVLVTFYLIVWHVPNITTQETDNRDIMANNADTRWKYIAFKSHNRINNSFANNSFDDKISKLKSNLGKYTEWVQNRRHFSQSNSTKKTLPDEITNLQHHLSSPNLLHRDNIEELETCVKDIEELLNFSNHNTTDGIDDNARNKFNDTIALLNDFKVHLYNRINTLKRQNEIASVKPFIDECVNEIKSYRFDSAEKKLHQMNYGRRISLVVKTVYNSSDENFYTLLNFGDSFGNNTEDVLILYEALEKEMSFSGHGDLRKLLLLIRRVKNKILTQLNYDAESAYRRQHENTTLKQRVESFLNILINCTKTAAIEEIADAFILDYLPKVEPYIVELSESEFFDMNIIIESVMDRISRKLSTRHLSSVIRADKGLCVNETTSTSLSLPYRLKRVLSWGKYCTLSQDVKKLAHRAMNSSPVTIGLGSIEYCRKVCIKSVNHDEYLYDPDSSECSDKQYANSSCPAYTTNAQSNGKSTNQLAWNLKPIDENKFQITSYNNNHTLFVDGEKWDDDRRCVSTKKTISERGEKYEWQFESDGDFVYIKNNHYQEYLSASVTGYINNVTTIDLKSMVTTSKRLRNVFTFVRKKLTPECYWMIVECP